MSMKPATPSKNISKEIIGYYLPPRPIIIEAGAHIGRDTVKMNKKWPHCTIHAFEPVPELFEMLTKRTNSLLGIHCYPYALSSQTEEKTLFVSSGRSTAASSLFKPTGYKLEHSDTVFTPLQIQTLSINDWAQKYTITHVDMLWLDMQGGELEALKGAGNIIKTASVIYTEVSLHQRYENTPLYPELKSWLEEQGFYAINEALTDNLWGNVLFIKKQPS